MSDSDPITPTKMSGQFTKTTSLNSDVTLENEINKTMDKKLREKAEKELRETSDIVSIRIRTLRHMLSMSSGGLKGRQDDAFLLRFLRAKKFDVDKSFKMIQKYYTMKEHSPELFRVSPPSEMRFMLEMQIQCMLPLRDDNGRKIYVFRVEKCDPYKIPVDYVFRSNVLALEDAIRSPETQIGGLAVLLDMSGLGFAHARYLSPHLAKRTVEVVQEAFPMRFKAFHVLHEPFYFDAILTVLKPFLKDKIRRRIYLHGSSLSSLHKHIPKDILPLEYGGTQTAFDNTLWRENILQSEEYFHNLETYNNETGKDGVPDNDTDSLDDDAGNSEFFDTETEDSEFDESDKRIFSPKHSHVKQQNIEEIFFHNEIQNLSINEKQKQSVEGTGQPNGISSVK